MTRVIAMTSIYNVFFLVILLNLKLFSLHPDIDQSAVPDAFYEEAASVLRWKTKDMRVATVEEWKKLPFHDDAVEIALACYHETAKFNLTPSEFYAEPHAYFQGRIKALDLLVQAIDKSAYKTSLNQLKAKAQRKKAYLQALPHPLEAHVIKSFGENKRKDINIRSDFWFERLDPLHRYGPEVYLYMEEWVASDIPNYFIFLETVEYHPMLNSLAPFEHYVTYYNSEVERQVHIAEFINGKVYVNKHLLNNQVDRPPFIFVLGKDNQFYINKEKIYEIHHSSEFAGGVVQSAGEMTIQNGKIISISNSSGHYGPKPHDILPALSFLQENYGSLEGIDLALYFDLGLTAHYDAQEFLITKGRCAALRADHGEWSPIHLAIALQQFEVAVDLSATQGDKLKDSKFVNPWKYAAENSDIDSLRLLLSLGVNPFEEREGVSGIAWVIRMGDQELADRFISFLNEVQIGEIADSDAIFHAAYSGSFEMVERLIKLGTKPDKHNSLNQNIMHFAVGGGPEMIEWLESLGLGHLENQTTTEGLSILHYAAHNGAPETLQYLLEKGFDPCLCDPEGNNIMHMAIQNNNLASLSWMIDEPAAALLITLPNNEGVTPLHLGAYSLPTEIFKKMVVKAADVDPVDCNGLTPYGYIAQRYGSFDLQSNGIVLLENGASALIRDCSGIAPWQYIARQNNMPALIHLLVHIDMDMASILKLIKNR